MTHGSVMQKSLEGKEKVEKVHLPFRQTQSLSNVKLSQPLPSSTLGYAGATLALGVGGSLAVSPWYFLFPFFESLLVSRSLYALVFPLSAQTRGTCAEART